MKDILRDSTIGQLLNWVSKGRILPYSDQRKDYVVPPRYLLPRPAPASFSSACPTLNGDAPSPVDSRPSSVSPTPAALRSCAATLVGVEGIIQSASSEESSSAALEKGDVALEKLRLSQEKLPSVETEAQAASVDPYLIDWDGPDDSDNPR